MSTIRRRTSPNHKCKKDLPDYRDDREQCHRPAPAQTRISEPQVASNDSEGVFDFGMARRSAATRPSAPP